MSTAALTQNDTTLPTVDPKTAEFLKEHQGHEQAHSQMTLIFMMMLILSQLGIISWKKHFPSSYNWASMLGLWIVPPILGFQAGNIRYIVIWLLFTISNALIVRKALEKPLRASTPNLIYSWYAGIYSICYFVGLVGYFIFLAALFRVPEAFGLSETKENTLGNIGLVLLFYGLYFGSLGRDFVERLADVMATSMGYYSKKGFPEKHLRNNVCAICGNMAVDTGDSKSDDEKPWSLSTVFYWNQGGTDTVLKLDCRHSFHESCIRGWVLIGKKDVCPYCKEKVDLRGFSRGSNPWDTTQILYLNLLDALRYIIVWSPIVFVLVHFIFTILGLK